MIANSVRLVEALELMEQATEGFSVRFVQADVARKTGGKIVEWHNCRLAQQRRAVGEKRPARPARPAGSTAATHYEKGTRNLVVGQSSQVRTVHIWLILEVNGLKVVLG